MPFAGLEHIIGLICVLLKLSNSFSVSTGCKSVIYDFFQVHY